MKALPVANAVNNWCHAGSTRSELDSIEGSSQNECTQGIVWRSKPRPGSDRSVIEECRQRGLETTRRELETTGETAGKTLSRGWSRGMCWPAKTMQRRLNTLLCQTSASKPSPAPGNMPRSMLLYPVCLRIRRQIHDTGVIRSAKHNLYNTRIPSPFISI